MNPRLRFLIVAAALVLAPRLSSAQSIAGVVRDAAGKPVARAIVAAVPSTATPTEDLSTVVRTDAEGRYRFTLLPPDRYALTVTARGFVAAFLPPRAVAADGKTTVDVVLERGGGHTLSGRTRDAAGKPRSLRVLAARFSADEGDLFVTESGADGRYEVRLPEAEYSVAAQMPAASGRSERVSLRADVTQDLHIERTFHTAPAAALAWIRKSAIPIRTAEPGALDDLAPLAHIVGQAHVVALGEATHGTREFFQLKHRVIQYLVEKMGFTVFAIEATMPGTLTVNEYVVDGKGSATAALNAMQFWTWNTDEVRALIEWMRTWNATHQRKVKFLGFDMQDPWGAMEHLRHYFEGRDAAYAATLPATFASLRQPSTYAQASDAAKQQARAAIDVLAKRVEAQSPHDAEWELARQMVQVLRQGEAQARGGVAAAQVRDPAMAANARWILAHEPPGTKMVLWAHNGHVTAEPGPYAVGGTMGSHLRQTFGNDLVIAGFAFNRGTFRALNPARNALASDNHFDAAPAGSFDAALASAGLPLFALDLRTARGPAREWLASPLRTRHVGAVFHPARPGDYMATFHPLRSFDAVLFVENMTAARGNDTPAARPAAPRTPPPPPTPAAVNLDFEKGSVGEPPQGWRIAGTPGGGFRTRLVAEGCANGHCAEVMRAPGTGAPLAFGAFLQRIDATRFRGKRVRLRARVRSQLTGAGSSAHIWLRVDRPNGAIGFFDNMHDRLPHELRDWTTLTIEGDIAGDAEAISFGSLFNGNGTAWYDDFVLEVLP